MQFTLKDCTCYCGSGNKYNFIMRYKVKISQKMIASLKSYWHGYRNVSIN